MVNSLFINWQICTILKNEKSFIELKKVAFAFCNEFVNARILRIRTQITEIENALTSETKSSAGDKHETGRAMIQLEREKLGVQLAEAEKMKQLLSKVPLNTTSETVGLGSFVFTDQGNYYIAISAGAGKVNQESFFCISVATPIGKLLLGKRKGDTFNFNQKAFQILNFG
ncbi:3-oxoacyl-ACP synthase [Maribacter sp. 2210JD10-5]|uniref:3-oxoacyl-ACP synthase n=1 Tax=Maribacter sp. 2210JD10-5 TaxID=3386272 RepID=UPI0039BC6989